MNLSEYLKQSPRGGGTALAVQIGVAQPTVSEWSTGKKQVPIERCVAIERATEGAVTRRDLRPDDWHAIWPEIIQEQHQPTTQQTAAPAATN